MKADRLSRYFPDDFSDDEIEHVIYGLLEEWNSGKALNKQ